MFRSGIDLRGKTHILKVGLLASLALLRCQRSLNRRVKCTTSRLLVNCLWTHQKSTCLHINEAPCTWQGSSSHTYLSPWETSPLFLETAEQKVLLIPELVPPRVRTSEQTLQIIWDTECHTESTKKQKPWWERQRRGYLYNTCYNIVWDSVHVGV